MTPANTVFCLITRYPGWYQGKIRSLKHTDKVRGDLAIGFVGKALKLGYKAIVIDGKSSKSFYAELKKIPGIILHKRFGYKRSPAKRKAIKIALRLTGVKAIILTEAEKVSLLDSVEKIVAPIMDGKADIIVPKRNDKLFRLSYPGYQYESETEGNKLYNETLKIHKILPAKSEEFDMFFGPKAFANKKEVSALFLKKFRFHIGKEIISNDYLDPEELSNTVFFPVIPALKKGLKVKSAEIPFTYPESQKRNEEILAKREFMEKRKNQKISLLFELLYFINELK